MATYDFHTLLQGLVSSIEPSKGQREGARRSQRALRESLDSGNIGGRILEDFLTGSYARHTAIAPLDDVDIIFVIDPHEWPHAFLSSLPVPARILSTFERAIRYRYPQSEVRIQRRSVGLRMHHLDIDAVPAIRTDSPKVLQIPDTKEENWIITAPEKHSDIATGINDARRGLFKPLVKLLKNWNANLGQDTRLSSFAIETLSSRIFRTVSFEDLYDGVLRFFDFLSWCFMEDTCFQWSDNFGVELRFWSWSFSYKIPDCAETGSNLAVGMTEESRKRFLRAALQSRERLLKADRAKSEAAATEYLFAALRVIEC